MPIILPCPHCGTRLRAADTNDGRLGKCPKCQTQFRFGAASASAPNPASASEPGKPPLKSPVSAPDFAPVSRRHDPETIEREVPGRWRTIAKGPLSVAVGLLAILGLKSLITAPTPADLSPQQRQMAEERASRWAGQQLRVANRKTDSENNVRQLQLDLNRFIAARDALAQEKELNVQKMVEGTLNGASNAETFGGALGRGFLGGAATRLVADEYDAKIANLDSSIVKLRANLGAWQDELRRISELGVQLAEWPRYQGHCYPIVRGVTAGGVAQGLDIQQGDLYLFYNGASLAYASNQELNGPRDEASRNNVPSVEIVFARAGKLFRHQVEGGKLLGVEVTVPISE